jgi:hypothetical protein
MADPTGVINGNPLVNLAVISVLSEEINAFVLRDDTGLIEMNPRLRSISICWQPFHLRWILVTVK